MYSMLPSRRKEKVRNIEKEMFTLVDRKEKKEQIIDDLGRSIVLTLRDYRQNQKTIKYKALIIEAKRYIKINQHFH